MAYTYIAYISLFANSVAAFYSFNFLPTLYLGEVEVCMRTSYKAEYFLTIFDKCKFKVIILFIYLSTFWFDLFISIRFTNKHIQYIETTQTYAGEIKGSRVKTNIFSCPFSLG